jgi:ribosome-associated heat shock protein Hsp15
VGRTFYKTRSLACEEISKGRVKVNGQLTKPSRNIKPGDTVTLLYQACIRTVMIRDLSTSRGSAPHAQLLYEETLESLLARSDAAERLSLSPEPALSIDRVRQTKRERRQLQQAWSTRWSASID